jgi:archaeosine-15-forming tRNA-guanine transglycosylase
VRARRGLILIAALGAACATRAGSVAEYDVHYTGRVADVGTDGLRMLTLSSADGAVIYLAGPLLDDLARLAGARVFVEGIATASVPPPGIDVRRYQVIDVDGATPWVGVLVRSAGGYALAEGVTIVTRLDRPPAALTAHLGARVWVTGPASADGVRVQSFGVIRPAG